MNTLEIFAITILPALINFYFLSRVYLRRLKAGDLSLGWDEAGVFFFALVMSAIWPISILWTLAQLPSREERRLASERAREQDRIRLERELDRALESGKS